MNFFDSITHSMTTIATGGFSNYNESIGYFDNQYIEITSIIIEASDVEIVSLDVEEQDTYLVNGYVTHNKGGNSHTDLAAPGAPTDIEWNNGTKIISWTAPSSVGTTGITAYNWEINTNSGFAASGQLTNGVKTEWSATSISTTALGLSDPHLENGTEYYFCLLYTSPSPRD